MLLRRDMRIRRLQARAEDGRASALYRMVWVGQLTGSSLDTCLYRRRCDEGILCCGLRLPGKDHSTQMPLYCKRISTARL